MPEINKFIPTVEMMKELGGFEVGKAIGDTIRKHPKEALAIGGGLVGLYLLKDKKFKFKFKRPDLEIEFETE